MRSSSIRSTMSMRDVAFDSSQITQKAAPKSVIRKELDAAVTKNIESLISQLKIENSREQIFALKFKGKAVPDNEIFKTIQAFSPTGAPKQLPATPENLERYRKFLESKERYAAMKVDKVRESKEKKKDKASDAPKGRRSEYDDLQSVRSMNTFAKKKVSKEEQGGPEGQKKKAKQGKTAFFHAA